MYNTIGHDFSSLIVSSIFETQNITFQVIFLEIKNVLQ